jgi:hypothetical protein
MLKNASEVTFVPKNIFFLKILNQVQSFVECKVSLADGFKEQSYPVTLCKSYLPACVASLKKSLIFPSFFFSMEES